MFDIRSNFTLFYDFYVVAKELSFSKAAEKYTLSQANLSRNIQDLEKMLKLTLLNRNNKGIESLTNDGERLFNLLDKTFSNFENYTENYLRNSDIMSGKLTIGTTRNIADNRLPFYLDLFYKKYHNVEIKIITDSAKNLNDYLLNHQIDVLIDYLPQINFGERYNIEVKSIGEFETCFACSKEFYEKNSSDIKSLNDLNNYTLIIPGASRRKQMLDDTLQPLNINLHPIMEMPDSKGMAEFIKHNDCIGYFIKEEVESYGLVPIKLKEEMPKNHIGIIYSKNTINNITKTFIELVIENSSN